MNADLSNVNANARHHPRALADVLADPKAEWDAREAAARMTAQQRGHRADPTDGGPETGTAPDNTKIEGDVADKSNEDSSFQSSGGGIPSSCRLPMYKRGFYHKSKVVGPLPAQRLSRGNSGKGSLFKGSLKNGMEDQETSGAEEGIVESEEGRSVGSSSGSRSASRRLRKALPSRLGRVSPMLDAAGDVKSDASSSLASRSLHQAEQDTDPASVNNSLSNLVDSQGFLGWDNNTSSDSCPTSKSDSSSTESSRGHALPAQMPLYGPGSYRKAKTGAPPPARRLTRSSSTKSLGKGSSFRGSLKNVMEDKESTEDADADVNVFKEDLSSQSSGGSLRPPRRTPLYAAGTWHKAKMGGPLPARRLTRSSSTKSVGKASSFRGSLKNVAEDKESMDDPDADANDFNEDLSLQPSGGSFRPPHRTPLYAPGTWRKVKMGGPLPARRLVRSSSTKSVGKGSSFRGSLKNVAEDKEADMDGESDDLEESLRSIHTAPHGRRKAPLARKLRTGVKKHFRLFHSGTTSSTDSSRMKESVDIMDFGVDPDALSLDTSSATNTTSRKDSYSNFVDSQGFLGWNNEASSNLELVGDAPGGAGLRRPALQRSLARRRLGSLGSSASSLTGLADSAEYLLGWDSQRRLADSAKDLGTDVNVEEGGEGGGSGGEGGPASGAGEENHDPPKKAWLIEDDEGSIDLNDLENPLSKMERFSSKVTEGIAMKRPSWNPVGGVPTEIQTNRRRSWYRSDSEPLSIRNKAKDDKGLLSRLGASLGASNPSQSLDIDDEYYSRGTIRINQEEDVDIGELRRELLRAAVKSTADNANFSLGRKMEKMLRIKGDGSSIDSNDLGNPLSKMKRFSSKVTEGIALKRPPWNPVGGVPTEIQTNRRRSWYRSESEPLPNRNKAKNDKGLLARLSASLGASSPSQSLDIDDEYYSRGNIRINQNDARTQEVLEVNPASGPVSLKYRALAAGSAAKPGSLGPCLEPRALAAGGAVPGEPVAPGAAAALAKSTPPVPKYNISPEISFLAKNFVNEFSQYFEHDHEVRKDELGENNAENDLRAAMDHEGTERRALEGARSWYYR